MKKKVILVGNAHLDPVWLWRWFEGVTEAISTCATAAKLMDEYPDFKFTRGEVWVYRWIERYHPELFERIKQLVQQRRWIVVNGWYVQPDMNAPSGESFVRQGLYGKRYFKERFGIEPTIGYCVDSFGHAAPLPQIFKKCGYEAYVFTRPSPQEIKLPQVFRWRWKDGSEIIGYRVSGHYETRDMVDLSPYIDQNIQAAPRDIPYVMAFYGVGDHGGGPTRYQLNWILENINYRDDAELVFGDPLTYFEKIRPYHDKLPVYEGEIHHHAVGCYSANAKIKWLNRQAENWLPVAEILSAAALKMADEDYPYDLFEDLWNRLNFNQFHDILSGTTIKDGAIDAVRELERVVHTAEETAYLKLHAIVSKVDTRGEGIPFIAFSSSPFAREEYVEFAPWTEWKVLKGGYVIDSEGRKVPFVNIQPHPLVWGQNRIVFKASLPPFGYRIYWLKEDETPQVEPEVRSSERPLYIENSFYRIKVTPDMRIEVFDRKRDIKLFDDFQIPLVIDDPYDTWGHKTWKFDDDGDLMQPFEASLVESTPFKATIRIKYRFNSSVLVQRITLYGDDKRIITDFQVNWHEENKQLRIVNRFRDSIKRLLVEAPYGFVERKPDEREQPMQRLLMAETKDYGVAVANDGKYAYDASARTLRINVLRCVPYAWHLPFEKEEAKDYDFIDKGLHEFTLWTWVYDTNAEQRAENFKLAHRLNRPLLLMSVPEHEGKLPPVATLLDLETSSNVLAEVLKLKEDDPNTIVLRAWETAGKDGVVKLEVGKSVMTFRVQPYELKTLLIGEDEVKEADLCENPIE